MFLPCRRRQQVPPNRWYISTNLHGITYQNTVIRILHSRENLKSYDEIYIYIYIYIFNSSVWSLRFFFENTDLLREAVQTLGYGLDGPRFESRQGKEIFLFSKTSTQALRPTQPPIQWMPGLFSRRGCCSSGRGVIAATHLPLALRWRIRGAIPLSPSWCWEGDVQCR